MIMDEKKTQHATVELINYADSAIAVTEDQEKVFINARIVDKMDLREGETLMVTMVTNFYDKRDDIPWRATRAERVSSPTLMYSILETMSKDTSYLWTAEELSQLLETDTDEIRKTLESMDQINTVVSYCLSHTSNI